MVGVLIITHGEFGAYLLEAGEEIVGRDPSAPIQALSISRRIPLTEVRSKIEASLRSVMSAAGESGVLVICDMLGGTPCNETLLCSRPMANVEVLTGVNLYMVISSLINAPRMNLSQLTVKVAEDGKRSVTNAKQLFLSRGKPQS